MKTITDTTTTSDEIILGEFLRTDGISVTRWVFIPADTIEHLDGSVEFVPSRVESYVAYPDVDEF